MLLAAALIVAGCGSTAPTSSASASPSVAASPIASATPSATSVVAPSQDRAAVFAAIEQQVEAIRGLQPRQHVQPTLLDEAGLHDLIVKTFERDNPASQMAEDERLLKHLGLLPPDASLAGLETEFLSGQVAGLYSPDDKRLYVVSKSGSLGPTERVTYAHEFTHELQDQTFGLGGIGLDEPGQGDRALARLALVEGDATLVMQTWEQANLSAAEIGQIANLADLFGQLAMLARMPPILLQTSLFPYTAGLQFVTALKATGGWATVDQAFRRPPDSTAQILHPELYLAGRPPVVVQLPGNLTTRLGTGWQQAMEDTLGELQLRIWLATGGGAGLDTSASGWAGDRIGLYEGPGGAWAVALSTTWTSDADAQRFTSAAAAAAARLPFARAFPGPGGPVVVIASDSTVLERLAAAF